MNNKDLFNILIPASRVERTINNIKLLKEADSVDNKINDGVLKAELFIAQKAFEDNLFSNLNFLSDISKIIFENIYSDAGKIRKTNRIYKNSNFNGINSDLIFFEFEKLFDLINKKFENGFSKLRDKLTILGVTYTSILKIHPFNDGNEKVARLYTNYLALKLNFNIFEIAPSKTDKNAYEKYLSEIKLADSGVLEFITFRIKKAINNRKKSIDYSTIGESAILAD